MATIVQTVTLVPAFMQEIKDDDRRLKRLLNQFRQLVVGRSMTDLDGLRLETLIREVRDRIVFHFALEEAYGYFEDPITVAPRLCDRIEQLRSEHGELHADACRIMDALGESESRARLNLAAIQEMCCEFLHRFDAHEAAENALIVQAFNEDIGVGD